MFVGTNNPRLLRHEHHSAEQRGHHRQSTPHSRLPPSHIVGVRRADSPLLLHLEPALHHRLLQLLVRQLDALPVPFVHLLRTHVLGALRLTHRHLLHLPVVQQRTEVDPIPPGFQDLVYKLHIPTHNPTPLHALEHHGRGVHEEARQHAVPLALLLGVAVHELARAHREITALRYLVARDHVGDQNGAIVVTRGEDVVRAVGPRIERDLRGRRARSDYGLLLEDVIQHVVRHEEHLVGELVALTAVAALHHLHEETAQSRAGDQHTAMMLRRDGPVRFSHDGNVLLQRLEKGRVAQLSLLSPLR